MSVLEWKTFDFFKLESIDNNAKYVNIIGSVTAHCGNSSYKIFCTNRGVIHIFLADWECISFQATSNPIIACAITDDSDVLAIIEQTSRECIIKCFSVLKVLNRKPVSALCYAPLEKNSKVCALNVCSIIDSQLWIAVGLDRGTIVLYKASLSRNVMSCLKTEQVCLSSIKGIGFVRRDVTDLKLCVCADLGVFYYNVSVENCIETKQIVDDFTEPVHCCTLMPGDEIQGEQYFVVGRKDALYCYTSEGLGPSYAINGTKEIVKCFGKHVYVVLKINGTSPISQKPETRSQLIIINIDNNIIVFNEVLPEVACVYPAQFQTKCLIFIKDGSIYTLRDQGIGYKLQLLYEKNLYDIALKMVEEQNIHPSIIANVNVRYAEYLLQRGDVAASVKMFIRTIGYISPFRVISRLLNIRYNEYIVQYLKVLIDTGHAYTECRSLHQNCTRRMELPNAINQIFNKLSYNYDNKSVEQTQTAINLSTLLQARNENGEERDLENGIVDVSPHYEHWIVSNWPLNAKQILKDISTNECLRDPKSRDTIVHLLLSLLFPNKDSVLDVISSIYCDQKPNSKINLVWAEILMQKWKSKMVDDNKVLDFFRQQTLQMNEDVHIICHTHKFWPGIKMVHDGHEMDALAMPWAHACEICPLFSNDAGEISSKGVPYQMLMQTLRKEYVNSNHSSAVFQQVVSNIFHQNPHNMLTVIQKVATSTPFNVSHINSVLTKEAIIKRLTLQSYDDISALERKLLELKTLFDGYANSPIEFRNTSCDACKQSLKQPSVYFACQHAYHRECLMSNSESNSCLACKNTMIKQRTERNTKQFEGDGQSPTFRNISQKITLSLCRSLHTESVQSGLNNLVVLRQKPKIPKFPFEDKITEIGNFNMNRPASNKGNAEKKERVAPRSTNPFEDPDTNPFM